VFMPLMWMLSSGPLSEGASTAPTAAMEVSMGHSSRSDGEVDYDGSGPIWRSNETDPALVNPV
jgi:hypothetical protein